MFIMTCLRWRQLALWTIVAIKEKNRSVINHGSEEVSSA